NTLLRFVSITEYHSSSVISAVTPPPLRPALFTRTPSGPNCSTAAATRFSTSAATVTSARTPAAVRPSARSFSTTASTSCWDRAHRKTGCPRRASTPAVARPIPLVPPVTSAAAGAGASSDMISSFLLDRSLTDPGRHQHRGHDRGRLIVEQRLAGRGRHPVAL